MIKNKVEINVELTAGKYFDYSSFISNLISFSPSEEWRKRYEKQKEECENLKRLLTLYTNELNLWRKGDKTFINI